MPLLSTKHSSNLRTMHAPAITYASANEIETLVINLMDSMRVLASTNMVLWFPHLDTTDYIEVCSYANNP